MRQDLDYWNQSKIWNLNKYILLKILKVCGLKKKTWKHTAWKIKSKSK